MLAIMRAADTVADLRVALDGDRYVPHACPLSFVVDYEAVFAGGISQHRGGEGGGGGRERKTVIAHTAPELRSLPGRLRRSRSASPRPQLVQKFLMRMTLSPGGRLLDHLGMRPWGTHVSVNSGHTIVPESVLEKLCRDERLVRLCIIT